MQNMNVTTRRSNRNTEDEPPPKPASCWERLRAEINPFQDWFLKQHPANDRPLDISSSFAPLGLKPLFFKLSCTAFVIGTAIYSFVKDRGDKVWWLAYATNWALLTGSVYMFLSLFMTLFGASQPYKRVSSLVVKSAWLIFSFSSHFSLLVAIFWWLYVFEKGVTPLDWLNIVPHGVIPFTVTFDGLNVNRIPLRWQHYIGFVVPMECIYVFWTYIQNGIVELDNPNIIVNGTSDDAIYEAYNWQEKGKTPLYMSLIGIFAIGPVLFFLEWMFSQYWIICCCFGDRRLYYVDPRKTKPKWAQGGVAGAGLAGFSGVNQRSGELSDDDSYDSTGNRRKDEEKNEDEPVDGQPKKRFRSKWEELAASG